MSGSESIPSSKASSVGDSSFDPVAYSEYILKTVGPNFHEDDPLFHTDEFRMHCYKVLPCTKRFCHDWSVCPFAHFSERAKRRDSKEVKYTAIACPDMKKGEDCPRGDKCPYSHNTFEYWLHPTRYRTRICRDGEACNRKICFFAHKTDEVRVPPSRPSLPVTEEQWPFNDEFSRSTNLACKTSSSRNFSTEFMGDLDQGLSPSFDNSSTITSLPQNFSNIMNVQGIQNDPMKSILASLSGVMPISSAPSPPPNSSLPHCGSGGFHVASPMGNTFVDQVLNNISAAPTLIPSSQMNITYSEPFLSNSNDKMFGGNPIHAALTVQNLLNSLYFSNTSPLSPMGGNGNQQLYYQNTMPPVTSDCTGDLAAMLAKVQLGNFMPNDFVSINPPTPFEFNSLMAMGGGHFGL